VIEEVVLDNPVALAVSEQPAIRTGGDNLLTACILGFKPLGSKEDVVIAFLRA
jgi:hypothetical protein